MSFLRMGREAIARQAVVVKVSGVRVSAVNVNAVKDCGSSCYRLMLARARHIAGAGGVSNMKMGAICAGAMLAMTGWIGPASAAEIKVMASAAIHDAYVELIPAFERATEN